MSEQGSGVDTFHLPREGDLERLGLRRLRNDAGLAISVLPNGCLFAIEYDHGRGRVMINQVLGSPIDGGLHRLCLRVDRDAFEVIGPRSVSEFGAGDDRLVWEGDRRGIAYRGTLWLHPHEPVWLWRLDVTNGTGRTVEADSMLIQDVGLGGRGFLMNNEAYASQYIDHHVVADPDYGPVICCRQNLAQSGEHPWVMHGCLPRAASYATDGVQVFGPRFRGSAEGEIAAAELPSVRVQHEMALPTLRSVRQAVPPGGTATWTFFALYEPHHPRASSDADLARLELVRQAVRELPHRQVETRPVERSVPQLAGILHVDTGGQSNSYTNWAHVERDREGRLLSTFANGHLVTGVKEAQVTRRTGHLVRTGRGMLLDEQTMSATAWMHGIFAAQVTLGNTSLHKLFSVSRDPYNVVRSSGLRILIRRAGGVWRLLGLPTLFNMGLGEAYWLYVNGETHVTVQAFASPDEPIIRYHVGVIGEPAELLITGHVVLGEREFDHSGIVEVDADRKRLTFRPHPDWLFGQKYPEARFHLVTSTPEVVDALGGDELLFDDGRRRGYGHVALRTRATSGFDFAIVGDLRDPERAAALAERGERPADEPALRRGVDEYWRGVTNGLELSAPGERFSQIGDVIPWFAHNVMVHLTVPHGLEQYTGAAWGTRDACQGPLEFMLAVGRHDVAKDILRNVFAQQYEGNGDWPQWYMHEPYSAIQDRHSHGDVIVWPLKALSEYLEATGDLAFLDESLPYRDQDSAELTATRATIAEHVDRLIAAVESRFIPGTHLIRYGVGDWNDALQPADPSLRDTMVSAWTVAILWQSLTRYADILRRAGSTDRATRLDTLTDAMRDEFNRHLMPDGVVAGYTIFDGATPKAYLLHPRDTETGLRHSLLPMTRSTIAGLFTPEQAQRHFAIIREHLLFPDGARLMDRPPEYRGGIETIFKRAESASFFGREIGLQYVHAHLRYAEALARLGDAEPLYEALLVVSPIAVTDLLTNAAPRQRNAYFSSSDAAFADREEASREWHTLKEGVRVVEGGWRVYSSGPGIYVNLVVRHLLGIRRWFDTLELDPVLPRALDGVACEIDFEGRRVRFEFAVRDRGFAPTRVTLNGQALEGTRAANPYRDGGLRIPLATIRAGLTEPLNVVAVTV